MESGTSEWTVVMNRLERLEKQNRRFKQMGALALILISSVLLMGQAAPKNIVEADEFILRDANGNTRANLDVAGNVPKLRLYDANQEVRAMLDANPGPSGPGLTLFDANGKPRASLFVTAKGPGISLANANGKSGANLILEESRGPGLDLYDTNGKPRVSVYVNQDGPAIRLLHASGKTRTLLDETNLELSNDEGFRTTIGSAQLVTPRTGETHKTSAASVVLFDKDKKVLWQAP